jgi:hypothetical protein
MMQWKRLQLLQVEFLLQTKFLVLKINAQTDAYLVMVMETAYYAIMVTSFNM